MSAFADAHAIPPQQIWDGVVGRAVQGEQATLALLELAPDSVVPEHSHPNEQLGICIEGSLTFRVGDETRELGPGGHVAHPRARPALVTTGPEGAVVVEVFSPARSDWLALDARRAAAPRWPAR